jgi:hypothetical protein
MRGFGRKIVPGVCAAVGLALLWSSSGCGESSPGFAAIDFKSPAVSQGTISPPYKCGGGSLWLPVEWGRVPPGTRELAIYMGHFHYKAGGRRELVVPFADLVSHISPSVHRIPANGLPKGVSWSYFGSSCPLRKGERVLQEVFAFDRVGDRSMNRKLATRLTEEATRGKPLAAPFDGAAGIGRFIAVFDR